MGTGPYVRVIDDDRPNTTKDLGRCVDWCRPMVPSREHKSFSFRSRFVLGTLSGSCDPSLDNNKVS